MRDGGAEVSVMRAWTKAEVSPSEGGGLTLVPAMNFSSSRQCAGFLGETLDSLSFGVFIQEIHDYQVTRWHLDEV